MLVIVKLRRPCLLCFFIARHATRLEAKDGTGNELQKEHEYLIFNRNRLSL